MHFVRTGSTSMTFYGSTLVVLTLLQLCRAEISDSPPDWYSANVINDGFQPKPISEIFSTEATFSSTNPIIVLPSTSSSTQETGFTIPSSTLRVSSSGSSGDLTELVSLASLTPSTPLYTPEDQTQPQTISIQTEAPSLATVQPIQTLGTTGSPLRPFPTIHVDPLLPIIPQTTAFPAELHVQSHEQNQTQTRSSQTQTQNQQIRLEIVPQNQPASASVISGSFTQPPFTQPSSVVPPPNYFLIYQQAPQNIQSYPSQQQSIPVVTLQNRPSTISTTLTPITRPLPQVTIQTMPSILPETIPSTTALPTTKFLVTKRANVTRSNCRTSALPKLQTTTKVPRPWFPLMIRVVAPVGSITNVKINPKTTTKKPTTKRTRKPKPKCRYDVCIDSCKGKKEPICGVPVSSRHIDPKTLKGFPSVCHMACHNSFRKDTYEKLVEGKCGKLRSRIRIVESNKKMTRPELKKTEYVVENHGTKTIVELSAI